jgi:hypothetical protein
MSVARGERSGYRIHDPLGVDVATAGVISKADQPLVGSMLERGPTAGELVVRQTDTTVRQVAEN